MILFLTLPPPRSTLRVSNGLFVNRRGNEVGNNCAMEAQSPMISARIRFNISRFSICVFVILLSSSLPAQPVFYEDFELSNDYTYAAPSSNAVYPEGTYTIATNPSLVHPLFYSFGDHQTGTGKMMIVNGVANTLVWGRTISNLVPGNAYSVAAYAASCYPTNPAVLQMSIIGQQSSQVTLPANPGTWTVVTLFFVANSSSVVLNIRDTSSIAGGNDFALDDITVTNTSDNVVTFREDFELSNDYIYKAPLNNTVLYPEGTYTITTNPQLVHSLFASFGDLTTGTGKMMVLNGVSNTLVWGHKIAGLQVGTSYTATVWGASAFATNPAILQLSLASGATGSSVTLTTVGLWTQISLTFTATSSTETLNLRDINGTADGNDFAIDNIVVVGNGAAFCPA